MADMTVEQALARVQDGLNELPWRDHEAEMALATLRAEVERLEKDAGRWRHARKLLTIDDIEGAQGAFDSFGGMVSEEECARADAAIDAAKGASHEP